MNYGSHYDAANDLYHVPFLGDPYRVADHNRSDSHPLTVRVPGSKSITNRALLLATLAQGTSVLRGVLFSDDSRHFLKCIQDLGFETAVDEAQKEITVTGRGGDIPRKEASLYVGSAGTAARFLTACLGVSRGVYHMDASAQMRRRPMVPLLDSLKELGCEILYEKDSAEGFFPFVLKGHGFDKDVINVNIEHSSQFLSALLISSRLADRTFTVRVEGSHGMAYIEMTRKMMEQFGVHTEQTDDQTFVTGAGQQYRALDYQVEPDVSAACYFYALAPLLHVPVLVKHVRFYSLQGDVAFLRILEQTGCTARETPQGILLSPPERLGFKGVTVDMSACSDQAITLAAIAPFADSPTTITGIGHIRLQESDRIHAIVTELGRMGIRCEEDSVAPGSITIYPGTPRPCAVHTYEDHRMAMGFTLIGLRVPGIDILDPGCCRKTFENYYEVLESAISGGITPIVHP
ncbi:MAG: 3-phosphoshikimate 1-carboxyvinyltransferase [Clostridium sp.]|nr:3-phosphoshikimate 1-carboxyvinyltransferase [Acetatifactor muris]MCM1525777.1 3-phosphoshikimate 1-carboxyvinyltransferase [Bacteroides sp.]MCM1564069.1 3-phosphoshikimate 1-carboxyvinyltransferase [Clostridium sp.]